MTTSLGKDILLHLDLSLPATESTVYLKDIGTACKKSIISALINFVL